VPDATALAVELGKGRQAIGEAEPVLGAQLRDGAGEIRAEVVRGRHVEVGEPDPETDIRDAGDRLGREPRDGTDGALGLHVAIVRPRVPGDQVTGMHVHQVVAPPSDAW